MAVNSAELPPDTEQGLPENADQQAEASVEQQADDQSVETTQSRPEELTNASEEILNVQENACTNPRALAEAMDSIIEAGLTEEAVKKVIETNPRLTAPELDAEQLARDIIQVEKEFVDPFKKQIEEIQGEDQEIEDLAPRAICSVREALYGMILQGRMSADSIRKFVPGGFVFQLKPGDEYTVRGSTTPEKAYAYSGANAEGQRTTFLYRNFLYGTHRNLKDRETWRRQSHLVRHEMTGHPIERSNAWEDGDFIAYRQAAINLDEESIAKIYQKNPELGTMLRLIQNPDLLSRVSSPYVASLCQDLQNLSPDDIEGRNQLRDAIACESVADTVAYFMESGRSPVSFLNNQLTFSRKKLMQYIESSQQIDDATRFVLSTGQMSMEKMIKILEADPGMKLVLESSKLWHAKLTEVFKNRGENLAIHQRLNEEDYDDDNYGYWDPDFDTESSERHDEGGYGSTRTPGQESKEPNVLVDIWDFLTGHNKRPNQNETAGANTNSATDGSSGGGGGGGGLGSPDGNLMTNTLERSIRGKLGNLKYYEGQVKEDLEGPRTLESVMAYTGRDLFEKVKAAAISHERKRGHNITGLEAAKLVKLEFDHLFNSGDNIETWSGNTYITEARLTDHQIARLKLGYGKLKHESLRALNSGRGDQEQSLIDDRMSKLMFGGSSSTSTPAPTPRPQAPQPQEAEEQLDLAA